MSRCVCGRTVSATVREWLTWGLVVTALVCASRAERERSEFAKASLALRVAGAKGVALLDSLRALPCVMPGRR